MIKLDQASPPRYRGIHRRSRSYSEHNGRKSAHGFPSVICVASSAMSPASRPPSRGTSFAPSKVNVPNGVPPRGTLPVSERCTVTLCIMSVQRIRYCPGRTFTRGKCGPHENEFEIATHDCSGCLSPVAIVIHQCVRWRCGLSGLTSPAPFQVTSPRSPRRGNRQERFQALRSK